MTRLNAGLPARPASSKGVIAQLVERVLCKHEVVGSIPSGSTIYPCKQGIPRDRGKQTSFHSGSKVSTWPAVASDIVN